MFKENWSNSRRQCLQNPRLWKQVPVLKPRVTLVNTKLRSTDTNFRKHQCSLPTFYSTYMGIYISYSLIPSHKQMSSHPSFRFCSVFPCTFFSLSFHCNRSTIISINTRNQIFIFVKKLERAKGKYTRIDHQPWHEWLQQNIMCFGSMRRMSLEYFLTRIQMHIDVMSVQVTVAIAKKGKPNGTKD